jgi:hypothetical protein
LMKHQRGDGTGREAKACPSLSRAHGAILPVILLVAGAWARRAGGVNRVRRRDGERIEHVIKVGTKPV